MSQCFSCFLSSKASVFYLFCLLLVIEKQLKTRMHTKTNCFLQKLFSNNNIYKSENPFDLYIVSLSLFPHLWILCCLQKYVNVCLCMARAFLEY